MRLKKEINRATPLRSEKRLRESVAFDASSVLFAKNLPSRELGAGVQKIPSHWTYKNLSSLCEYSTGKTPIRNNVEYWSNGKIPWMSISDMKQGEIVYKTKEKISNQAFKEKFSNKAVPKGTLLMSFKLTIGRTCFAGVDLTHNEAIIAIYPKKTEIDKLYLSFYLPTVDYSIYQDRAIKGNTLNKSKINKIKIPLPPLEEQKKIAGVLSRIQKAMEVQDKLIERTIELKKTTMKHLFTYGTEKTSAKLSAKNLPSRELGAGVQKIPSHWEVKEIEKLFKLKQGKSLSSKNQTGLYKKPFLRTSNVFWGYLNMQKVDEMDIPEKDRKELVLRKGDLLVCEGGDIGRTAIWNNELSECYYQNHIHRLRARSNQTVFPLFFMYWMDVAIRQLNIYGKFGNRTTIPNLSGKMLLNFKIPLPLLEEQKKIADILQKIDDKISIHRKKKSTLTELFKTMLKNLMTGQIRVHKLDINTNLQESQSL